eukprot:COSAG01_NODE_2242_length_8077_cov_35.739544_8_plen_79_part_00
MPPPPARRSVRLNQGVGACGCGAPDDTAMVRCGACRSHSIVNSIITTGARPAHSYSTPKGVASYRYRYEEFLDLVPVP